MALFLLYSYSSLTANFYSDKFENQNIDMCNSLASCFFYTMNMGIRNGGGLADSMEPYEYGKDSKFGLKLVFDLSYFIIINTIILNIVFGVIIDTFGDMRDEAFRRQEILDSTCLICLNQKQDIDASEIKFKAHTEVHHNIWDYINFIVYLQSKQKKLLSYVEEEALLCIEKRGTDWIPLKSTFLLDSEDDATFNEEEALEKLNTKFDAFQESIVT